MTGAEVRASFLDFFRRRGHAVVRRASLIPAGDPTLLFTNAGMVQFKNVFLGSENRSNSRAVDSQVCLRLSGKHNDLEEVGRDTYHHTLFEMLGNWSFGDYYKEEAIAWAWELLTQEWGLPKKRLWATVFRTDDEAAELWLRRTDLSEERILRFDEADNFWEMGDAGPCGPCSEIHFDRGPGSCDRQDDALHRCAVNAGCARYVELWNLVFIQHNRLPAGRLEDLGSRHVDTGMGLERVTAVLQGVASNYDTDLFGELIRFTEQGCGRAYGGGALDDLAFRVIADHARALSFMITDGVVPGNDGRGYVLRRLLRRAARHARQLGFAEPFLWQVAGAVADSMGDAYPELRECRTHVEAVVRAEEERFAETLDKGLALLEERRAKLRGEGKKRLDGSVAFRLYDTYGFPLDMTQDILRNEGIEVDTAGFEGCMNEQRKRAREARKAGMAVIAPGSVSGRFAGDGVVELESEIVALYVDGEEREEVREGETLQLVSAETPFYGESGGQVGDRGRIETAAGACMDVVDTQRPRADLTVHVGTLTRGALRRGGRVTLRIDVVRRGAVRLNHSATHIVHAVLRSQLGTHVRQAGSLVSPQRMRFDFTHPGPIDTEMLARIEDETNARIRENAGVDTTEMAYDEAIGLGALAFFGEKYGERVRVVRMGDFSTELCGGTHVRRTGDIGVFKLRAESGVAAGVRRIEGLTGAGALAGIREHEITLRRLGDLLKGTESEVAEKVERLVAQQREAERQLTRLRRQMAGTQTGDLWEQRQTVRGKQVVAGEVDGADNKRLREMADRLRERLGSGVVVLASRQQERVNLLAAVTPDLTSTVHAGKLIAQVAGVVGGKGGGRPDMAQAGGKDPSKIAAALRRAIELIP